ncbi:MAG: hypothetical protein AB7S26_29810 [Sandaracinaceae bacterium]
MSAADDEGAPGSEGSAGEGEAATPAAPPRNEGFGPPPGQASPFAAPALSAPKPSPFAATVAMSTADVRPAATSPAATSPAAASPAATGATTNPEEDAAAAFAASTAPLPGATRPVAGGAVCAVHHDAQAVGTCGRCGNFVCPLCLDPIADEETWCESCRQHAGGNRIAWERTDGGLLGRWYKTTRDVLLSPQMTFERARPGALMESVTYNAMTGVFIGLPLGLLVAAIVALFAALGQSDPYGLGNDPDFEGPAMVLGAVLIFFAMPVVMAIVNLVTVAIRGIVYYLALLVMGAQVDAAVPFWTVAYASGAMSVAYVPIQIIQQIPIIGPIIGLLGYLAMEVWYALTLTMTAQHHHGLSQGRAAMAGWAYFIVFAALIGSCCCIGFFAALMGNSGL